jgi:hypothetical protein
VESKKPPEPKKLVESKKPVEPKPGWLKQLAAAA